jgi:hypothetical protein
MEKTHIAVGLLIIILIGVLSCFSSTLRIKSWKYDKRILKDVYDKVYVIKKYNVVSETYTVEEITNERYDSLLNYSFKQR